MYELPEQLLKELLNYLAQRPYVEVHQAIQTLQGLNRVELKAPKKPDKTV